MNPSDVIKKYESQGIGPIFMLEQKGDLFTAKADEKLRNEINQIGVILFETIAAIGQFPISEVGVVGQSRGLVIKLFDQRLAGMTFDAGAEYGSIQEQLNRFIQDLTKPEEKVEIKVDANIFDRIKAECLLYLGDFAEKIYQNQLKAQKVNMVEAKIEDAKRLVFGLNKAASMIIGPKRAKEMMDKLLEFVK